MICSGIAGWVLLLMTLAAACHAQQTDPQSFPLSERWSHYLRRTYSPARVGLLAADTAIDHALREPACWDRAADSYGQRFARSFERRVIRNSIELTAGALTGEDLRYRRSKSTAFHARLGRALQGSVMADVSGKRRPAYTRFVAGVVADASVAHWTGQPVRPRWLAQSVGWTALGQFQTNLLDEFGPDMRRIGARMWTRIRNRP